jgi:flagellin-like protein
MKGVSELISAVLVVLIAIALVAMAYTWGLPLIQKMQSRSVTERVAGYFDPNNANSLQRKITNVANRGGEDVFSIDVDGIWMMSANSIQFTFFSKATNIGPGDWVPISAGSCNSPLSPAYLGSNSFVTCARADPLADGYNITYQVWFRELVDPNNPNVRQKIELEATGPTTSTGKTIRISRGDISTTSQGLTITKVKILLG